MSIAEKLQTIAENAKKVFDAGKQDERRQFWESYQTGGSRTLYSYAFSGEGWNEDTFYPLYPITMKSTALRVFESFSKGKPFNLKQRLEDCNVELILDLTALTYFFTSSGVTELPYLNAQRCSNITSIVSGCVYLKNFEMTGGNITTATGAFSNCTSLTDVKLDMVIATNIDLHWSPLTKESIESVMEALYDTLSGKTASFKSAAVNTAFETSQGAADGSTSEEWLALVAAKPNWTITLA